MMASSALPAWTARHGRLEGRARQRRHVGKGRAAGHVGIGAGLALEGDGVAGHGLCRRRPSPSRRTPPHSRRHCPVGRLFRPPDQRRQPPADRRKTSQNPGLATFRRASPRRRSDTTGGTAGVLQQRPEFLALSGSDYGQFQHGCGLRSGLGPLRDGGGQGLQRRGSSAQAREARARRRPTRRRQTAAAAAPAQELPPIGPKLAGANVEAGKAIFQKQCFTCHTIDKGGAEQGRPEPVGHRRPQEGEPRGLQLLLGPAGQGRRLDLRRHRPHDLQADRPYVRGTKMAFAGLPKEQERADVIAYLRTMARLAQAAALGRRRRHGRIGSRRAGRSGPSPRRRRAADRGPLLPHPGHGRRQDRLQPGHHRRPRGRDGHARAAHRARAASTACSARSTARCAPMPTMSGCSIRSTAPRPSSPACRSSAR